MIKQESLARAWLPVLRIRAAGHDLLPGSGGR